MRRFLVATLLVLGMLAVLAPTAQAIAPGPTYPSAVPDTIYPYVMGGRPDTTLISFDSVLDSYLAVFDSNHSQVFTRNAGTDGTVQWSGEMTGGGLVPADNDGEVYSACVFHDVWIFPSDEYVDNCTEVTVVHYSDYFWLQKGKKGKAFKSAKVGGPGDICTFKAQRVAVLVKCRNNSAAILRYTLKRPDHKLTSEQTFTGNVSVWTKHTDFRNGFSVSSTKPGARIVTDDGYWGKVQRVFKSWEVHEEY